MTSSPDAFDDKIPLMPRQCCSNWIFIVNTQCTRFGNKTCPGDLVIVLILFGIDYDDTGSSSRV